MGLLVPGYWLPTRDGDPRAFNLMRRHYSFRRYADGRRQRYGYRNRFLFVGPGESMVLLTEDCRALFVWLRAKFRADGQHGVCCTVFRNEGDVLSSELVKEACELAWHKWPGARLYTLVDPKKVRSSNPGYCFQKAGWWKCGVSKSGQVVLEILPTDTEVVK
jgi:hypothetical protein